MAAEGARDVRILNQAGFSTEEIEQFVEEERSILRRGGFSEAEIDQHFGVTRIDPQPMAELTDQWLSQASREVQEKGRQDLSILRALELGFGQSVSAMLVNPPEQVDLDTLSTFDRIVTQAGTFLGDAPFMAAGALASGVGTGPFSVLMAPAGAFALPAAMRSMLMEKYVNGEVDTFREFWESFSSVFLHGAKGYATGLAVGAAGAAARAAKAPAIVAFPTEVVTMVKVGAALEGHQADWKEYLDAGVILGGFKGLNMGGRITGRLVNLYRDHGVTPRDVLRIGREDPTIFEDLVSHNIDVPRSVRGHGIPQPISAPETLALDLLSAKVPRLTGEAAREARLSVISDEGMKGAVGRVLDRISVAERGWRADLDLHEMYTKVKDRTHPLNLAVDEMMKAMAENRQVRPGLGGEKIPFKDAVELEPISNPWIQARLEVGSASKATHFLEFRPFKYATLEPVGEGLRTILGDFKQAARLGEVRAYLGAKRALEKEAQGIETGINVADATRTVEVLGERLEPIRLRLQAYQDHVLQYLVDAGIITRARAELMREANRNFVPFYRYFEQDTAAPGVGRRSQIRQPIFLMKGSKETIVDPLESIIKNTYMMISIAEKNRVARSLVELAEKSPIGARWATKRKPLVKPIRLSEEEIHLLLKQYKRGEKGEVAEPLTEAQAERLVETLTEEFSIFRRQKRLPRRGEITLFRNGEAETWKVDPLVWQYFNASEARTQGLLVKMLTVPASLLRAGAILSPEFIARNPARDQLSAFIFSKNNFWPFLSLARGAFEVYGRGDLYQKWLRSGGAQNSLVALDRDYLSNQLRSMIGSGGLWDATRNLVKTPLEALRMLTTLMEEATRVEDFRLSLDRLVEARRARISEEISRLSLRADLKPKERAARIRALQRQQSSQPTVNELMEASFDSRELTLDFQRRGASVSMETGNMITAFLNANLEGPDRTVRGLRDHPQRTLARIAATITLPSLMLYSINRNKEGFDEIPAWQRDLYWPIQVTNRALWKAGSLIPGLAMETNGFTWFRIPKPHALGVIFGSAFERIAEWIFEEDPRGFEKTVESFVRGSTPSLIPQAFIPIIETFANRSLFLDRPLIPQDLEGRYPEYQFQSYTTELTKFLGRAIADLPSMRRSPAASPLLIDNWIRAWTGGLGKLMWDIASKTLSELEMLPPQIGPAPMLSDVPFFRAFIIRHPTAGAESVQRFYEGYFERQTAIRTLKDLAKDGDLAAISRLFEDFPASHFANVSQIERYKQTMDNLSSAVHMLSALPKGAATREEKALLRDEIFWAMIAVAKEGNKIMEALDKIEEAERR